MGTFKRIFANVLKQAKSKKKNLVQIQKEHYQISFKKCLKAGGNYFFLT